MPRSRILVELVVGAAATGVGAVCAASTWATVATWAAPVDGDAWLVVLEWLELDEWEPLEWLLE